MSAERWRQINELFHRALEQDPTEREALLRTTADTDPELAREVRSLLATHERAEGFLDVPAWGVAADLLLDDEPSLTGKQLGSYRVLEEIGRGGMGVVYAAQDERLDRKVALKALPPAFTRNRKYRERLAREAKAAAAFVHEAIATVFALEEIDGELFIASELVEGRTLRDELTDGPLPPDRLIDTLIEIASGMAAAHAHNVIHRDLKPENIIRRTDGHIKILDFGLARISDPHVPTVTKLTEPGTAPGTPGYMAPEQLSGGEVDARTDLFAFGVVAWELATGEHPFGPNSAVILARMMEGRLPSAAGQLSNPALETVIRRCLRAAPAERYPSADVLLEDLRRLKHTSGVGSGVLRVTPPDDHAGLWWWQFHQITMTAIDVVSPILAGLTGSKIGEPTGTWVFFVALALATAAVTLRLNLLFTARVHPVMLASHRAGLFPWIAVAETVLAALLLISAATILERHEVVTGIQFSLAIVMLASLALIEPATTRGAGLGNAARG